MAKTIFVDADKSQGRLGTRVLAAFLNGIFTHRHRGLNQNGDGAIDYALDTGAANAYVIALTPALDAYTPGMPVWFQASAANTGPSTLNINGIGPTGIKKFGTQLLAAEDIRAGQVICAVYDGACFQMITRGLAQQSDGTVNYAADGGVANAYAVNLTPALAGYITGVPVLFCAANTNTGAATLSINGLGAVSIKKRGNLALDAGDIVSGQVIVATYDGNCFQLLTPAFSNGVPVGSILYRLSRQTPPGYIPFKAASLLRAQYAELFSALVPQFTVSLPVGSPLVIPKAAHGLYVGERVRFVTTGGLPTGLNVGQDYYVIAAGYTADTFEISATLGGAAIVTSGTQNGVHTLFCWSICSPGADETTFNIPDPRGYFLRIWDGGRGVDTNRLFGSFQDDALATHTHQANQTTSANDGGTGGGSNGYARNIPYTGATGGPSTGNSPETRPLNMAVPAYIKY